MAWREGHRGVLEGVVAAVAARGGARTARRARRHQRRCAIRLAALGAGAALHAHRRAAMLYREDVSDGLQRLWPRGRACPTTAAATAALWSLLGHAPRAR